MTTLQPGAAATVRYVARMHAGMEGPHLFRISIPTTHAKAPMVQYTIKGTFG